MELKVDIKKKLSKFQLNMKFDLNVGFNLNEKFDTGAEAMAIIGPSGCGKTMTLKCIAGIEKPDSGIIELNGRTIFDLERKINLSPQDRRIGLMFQNYALFPNMTVEENILCGGKRLKNKNFAAKRTEDLMRSLNLISHRNAYPWQLSGGQQQRTALARILVSEPETLLLDEPFSALDSELRERLYGEMKGVLHELGKPVIIVTHEPKEAFTLASKAATMREGQIVDIKTRAEMRSNYTDYLIEELKECGVDVL